MFTKSDHLCMAVRLFIMRNSADPSPSIEPGTALLQYQFEAIKSAATDFLTHEEEFRRICAAPEFPVCDAEQFLADKKKQL